MVVVVVAEVVVKKQGGRTLEALSQRSTCDHDATSNE
jgi:hypothetical protein